MKIIKITSKNLNSAVKEAVRAIKQGKVLVCPTDTVYGLIADAGNENSVSKIFKIKKRSFSKTLPVFAKDLKMAGTLGLINEKKEIFLGKFWPGKLTAVLKAKKKKFPKGILSKGKKIGLRIPNYKFLKLLLDEINFPLAQTSANISGEKETTKIKEILRTFEKKKHKPDLVLDKGSLKPSLPSTVIDISNSSFEVLREGEIRKEKVFKIFNNLIR